jgi:hypothetical protein
VSGTAGKLSFRLQLLSEPALAQASADVQAEALSLPAKGPGSLLRNAEGKLLLYVAVSDISESAIKQLTQAGATVVNVAEAYCTVTIYAGSADLMPLANLPFVVSLKEALSP